MTFFLPYAAVILLRVLGPLFILKKPFWGFAFAIFLDAVDMELIKALGPVFDANFVIDFAAYHRLDKFLDLFMNSVALYASFSWTEVLAKRTASILYAVRFVGVALFEIFAIKQILFFFPNLFEFFFLFYAYVQRFLPDFRIATGKRLALILFLLLVPKLAEEYLLHFLNAAPLAHFKHDVLGWPRTPAD